MAGSTRMGEAWRNWQWPIVTSLVAFTFALGAIGFGMRAIALNEPLRPLHFLYLSLQLFVLESGAVASPVPLPLQIARFLAPALAAYTALKALAVLFSEQLTMLALRRMKKHVVICGLGRNGSQLAREFLANGDKVAAIECDESNDEIEACRRLGAIILVGNATDSDLLKKAGIDRAAHLIAVSGNDGVNLEIATRARELLSRRSDKPLQCHLHIVDLRLCDLFHEYRVFNQSKNGADIRIFNSYTCSSRALFQQHPLDHVPISAADPRAPQLIIIGFGQMGQSILVQAAKIAHFANGKKLRATIVDKDAMHGQRLFYGRYPNFDETCQAEFIQGDAEEPENAAKVLQLASDPAYLTTMVLCVPEDCLNLSLAFSWRKRLGEKGAPILVRLNQNRSWNSVLQGEAKDHRTGIHPFGLLQEGQAREHCLSENLDKLARAIHEDFAKKRIAAGRPPDHPSVREWDRLGETYKNSNRQQADHIPIKLRAINCHASASANGHTLVTSFSDPETELMARMEHARWNAERFLDGWRCGPRNDEEKINPCLVPWEKLDEETKGYDRDAVENIFYLLSLDGQRIYRD